MPAAQVRPNTTKRDYAMNITVSQRITLGYGVLTLLLIWVGLTALHSFNALTYQLKVTSQEKIPALLASSFLGEQLNESFITTLNYSRHKQLNQFEAYRGKIADHNERLTERITLSKEGLEAPLKQHLVTFIQLSNQQIAFNETVLKRRHRFQSSLMAGRDVLYELKDSLDSIALYADESADQWAANAMLEQVQFYLSSIDWVERLNDPQDLEAEQTRLKQVSEQLGADATRLTEQTKAEVVPYIEALERNNTAEVLPARKIALIKAIRTKEQGLNQLADITERIREGVRSMQRTTQQDVEGAQQASESLVANRYVFIGALLVIAVMLSVISGYLIIRSIKKSLANTGELLSRLEAGDLTSQATVLQHDELGNLTEQCNLLSQHWRQMMTSVSELSGHVADKSDSNMQLSEEILNASKNQSDSLMVSASTIEQVSQAIAMVARRTEIGLEQIDISSRRASDCDRLMQLMTHQVESLSQQLQDAMLAVEGYQKNSEKIDQVVDVIESLADQTTLLALNAAIEAARSGAAGRGFAVVADEVKSLAESTHQSTEQIQGTVTLLQQDSRKTYSLIKKSSQDAVACADQTRNAQSELKQLLAGLEDMQQLSSEIASATEEQSVGCHQVSAEIQKVADEADRTADKSARMAELNQELAAAAHEQSKEIAVFNI